MIGKLAKEHLKGELTLVSSPGQEYTVRGDVALDNKIILEDQLIDMDVGTDNIQGYVTDRTSSLRRC